MKAKRTEAESCREACPARSYGGEATRVRRTAGQGSL